MLCGLPSIFWDVSCWLAVFSDRFSEGTLKNLREGFPSDEEPYTDSYDYLSDSDLDSEAEGDTEADEPPSDDFATYHLAREEGAATQDQARGIPSLTTGRSDAQQATATTGDLGGRPGMTHVQPGKVAIIRDMAATTYASVRNAYRPTNA